MVELDLVSRIIDIIWDLVEVICSIAGIDFIEMQQQLIKDDKAAAVFIKILPQNVLNKAA
jgi:hypothetical protein